MTELDRRAREALEQASRYFMGCADVQIAAKGLAARLEWMGIPYAICGGLAVAAWGYRRTTSDVDVLLTPEGLDAFVAKELRLRGGIERPIRIGGVRDDEHRTPIHFLLTGRSPGGDPRLGVRFPDPQGNAVTLDGRKYLDLPRLVELKLARGLSSPDRLQDFADVIALVRANSLPEAFDDRLHAEVRSRYGELWILAQHPQGEY